MDNMRSILSMPIKFFLFFEVVMGDLLIVLCLIFAPLFLCGAVFPILKRGVKDVMSSVPEDNELA
ncbi:hypothetical protein ACXDLE_005507 [Klebsiella variicola]